MPNLNILNLLQTHPSTDFIYAGYAFAFILTLFLGAFILTFIQKKYIHNNSLKKVLKSVPSLMWWMAIVALVMTWGRIEGVAYISMRIWWIVMLAVIMVIVIYKWRKYTQIEKRKALFKDKKDTQDTKKKYLPKSK
jgi:Ca2+/Na+ antiporter